MSETLLAALILFNTSVARFKAEIAPDARIYVGVQAGPEGSSVYAWTKCVPDSPGVFVTQVAEKTLRGEVPADTPQKWNVVTFAAAHEVCHVALHRSLICAGTRTAQMERQADECATRLLTERRE